MKRRVIASLLTLVLCLTLLPAPAFAADTGGDTPEPAATDIYVSSTAGNDSNAGTTKNTAVATLAKAVEIAPDGATIYVLSDLTMTECARFYNKNLTITSGDGGSYTVTRGDGFEAQSDTARSWYNPAMIEVQGNQEGAECGLTLKNIILDDAGEYEGTVFAQAISGKSEEDKDNLVYVQDAMIASNATVPCTITLGEGAVLRNFGGMSAVRVTDQAKLVMKSGSVIEDTLSGYTRSKGTDTRSVGPAGAVWLQGGSLEMENGAKIRNINGRAVYADGGSVSVGGTISGITGNPAMWQGKEGTAIHLRNNATGTLTATGLITNVTGGGTIVNLSGSTYTMDAGSVMSGNQGNNIAAFGGANTIFMNGEITGIRSGNGNGYYDAINLQVASNATDLIYCKIGATGNIHDNNVWYGSVYVQGNNIELHHYGKINNNSSSDKSGGIVLANNFPGAKVIMYDGAEVIGNKSDNDGAGVMVSYGTFTMNGGKISGNIAMGQAGGVYVRRGGQFIMNGGEISNNHANKYGGGVSFVASDYFGYVPYVALNGGMISSNTMGDSDTKVSNDLGIASSDYSHINRYLYISDDVTIGNKAVYFQANSKTVTPADDSLDIKLGNASTDSVTALSDKATANGWNAPLATFWVQRNGGAELMIDGLTLDSALPQIVYALVQETGEDGKPASGAAVRVYSTEITADGIRLTLPNGYANGCAVALAQPTTDFGTVVITSTKPELQETVDLSSGAYEVPYTATYTMSDNLLSMLKNAQSGVPMTFVVELDSRLTAKKGLDGNYDFLFDGAGILEVNTITESPDEHTITVLCKPVADWKNAIKDKTSVVMTLTGTGVLDTDDFEPGDYLNTTGHIVGMIDQSTSVLIPANLCRTKMIGRYDVIFDWNDGSNKKKTVSVVEGGTVGDQMPADPSRSGYTFTGWNTKTDGTGNVFTSTTNVTDDLTVYAQWKRNGGGGGSTNYYLALKKVDAQDGHALSGAQFGLYQDGKQLATATSDRNGLVMFTLSSKNYKNLYCQELIAPEGYVMNKDKITVSANDLTTSRTTAEKSAETVRNYRGVTPDLLNDADHFAYVIGYPDGAVRPQGNITRAETATIFFRMLKDAVRNGNLLTSNAYQDVASSYWANTAISTMTGLGILQGRDSATFDPNAPITRAEFAAICARFDTGKSSGSQTFSDIRGHWAQDYIERAAELGWVKGFEDGSFRPNDCITRAQAMTMINRVLNRIPEDASDLLPDMNVWPDCNPGDWFYLAVQEATNSHNYKHKAGNYETWISMKEDPDWTRYEN